MTHPLTPAATRRFKAVPGSPKSFPTSLLLLPAVALLSILSGCAGTPAPTEQMAVSSAAVGRASGAGATEMAPAEMQMAREKLDKAKQAMTREDFDEARQLAQQAQVDAQLAEAKSRSSTARKAAGELREGVRVLSEELERKNK